MKKKYINRIVLGLLGLVLTTSLMAQTKNTISGRISDEENNPLPGVEIFGIEGKFYATTSDDGSYNFEADVSEMVQLTKEGYGTMTMSLLKLSSAENVQLPKYELYMGGENTISVPFGQLDKRKITGQVNSINVEDMLEYDTRFSLGAALSGKVPGVFSNYDIYGVGGAAVIIDGVPRDPEFYNLSEIEEITVLKDPVSKLLYGVQSDKGLILVTTKRGNAFKRRTNIFAEYGVSVPKVLPEYLGSAEYMSTVNQAFLDDGKSAKFSDQLIENTLSGENPVRYPDEEYYSDRYLRSNVGYTNVKAEFSGGNQLTQYYVNMGWNHQQGWMNLANEMTDELNMRGSVDYKISDRLNMSLDGLAYFDIYNAPDADFWNALETSLPNSFPVLVPTDILTDPESVEGAVLIDDQYLLGGTKVYSNSLYGDMTIKGNRNELNRMLQLNTALDYDLGFIAEGLKAKAYLSFDFYNEFVATQNTEYAVYNPSWRADSTGNIDSIYVTKIGKDEPSNKLNAQANEAYFHRRYGTYGSLTYDKVVGEHNINAIAVAYRDQLSVKGAEQDQKNLHFALKANYMFRNKYLAELGGAYVGTQKLAPGERMTFVPAVGIGWILSEESFLSGSSSIDFLKIKATYGLTKNDNWNNYFLYQTAFQEGGWFNYANSGTIRNREMEYLTIANNIGWQMRKEFTAGFEALLLSKSLYLEAGYFNNQSVGLITEMQNAYPALNGGVEIFENYNSFMDQGIELGVNYSKRIGDIKVTLGSNILYATPEVTKMDEPFYAEDAQYRYKVGKASDAIWGWVDEGLYGESDFDGSGNLQDGLPQPTFGSVQPGDIKYQDLNDDGVIDADDQEVIGNNQPRLQYSITLRLNYKKLDLYMLGLGQYGQERLRNSDYYWAFGEMKYSVEALNAYGSENQDINATMPRLSSVKNNNNYRTSTFWMYENNWFRTPTIQVSYNFADLAGIVKNLKVYVRGYDVINLNKNKAISDLRTGAAPQTWGGVVGLVSTF